MAQKIPKEQLTALPGLIGAGLEYGDSNKDRKMDKKLIELEFPRLNKILPNEHLIFKNYSESLKAIIDRPQLTEI